MQSAPATIPATIAVTFPAGLTPAEAIRVDLNRTPASTSSERPARSASAIVGTSPAKDTRLVSSNSTAGRDHACDSFTGSAFLVRADQCVENTDSSDQEGIFGVGTPLTSPRNRCPSTDRG